MTRVDQLYQGLVAHIDELEAVFLKDTLTNPLAEPNDYKHQVGAYCVLSHAALEEYFEEVAMSVMTHSINTWLTKRVFNDCLLSLISHSQIRAEAGDETKPRRTFDVLRESLRKIQGDFSRYVKIENHGADLKYLQKLMEPIGIDIINDHQLLASLGSLAKERGYFAHRALNGRVSKILPPEDAKDLVSDCLKLCHDIKEKANLHLTLAKLKRIKSIAYKNRIFLRKP